MKASRLNTVETVLVTGAEGALGRAAVAYFAAEGRRVFASCRRETDFAQVIEAAGDGRAKVSCFVADLGDETSVQHMIAEAFAKAPIDGLLNAAGAFVWAKTTELSLNDFDLLITANLKSSFLLAKHLVPHMLKRDFGRLVFVSSRSSLWLGDPGVGLYTASKAGLNAMIASLATEVKKTGVRVGAVAPTIIDTEGNRRAMPDATYDDWVTPHDLLQVVSMLMGEGSAAMNGAIIQVPGRV